MGDCPFPHPFDDGVEGPHTGEVEFVAVHARVQWMGVAVAERRNKSATIETHDLVELR